MNKRLFNGIRTYSRKKLIPFILCTAFFSAGCIAGVFLSREITADDPAVSYVLGLISSAPDSVDIPGYFSILISELKFHLPAFMFGFSILGVVFLPLLSAARGFLLTFSVSFVTRTLGIDGGALILCFLGAEALVTVPSFFILSTQALDASGRLLSCVFSSDANDMRALYSTKYFKCALICFGILFLWVLLKKYFLFTLFV